MGRASSNRSRAARRARVRARGSGTAWPRRFLRGLLPRLRLVVLSVTAALAVGAFAVVIAMAATSPAQGSSSASGGSAAQGSTGASSGQPAPDWVSLASTNPADILAAARATTTFQEVYNTPQTMAGQALHAGTLGTPVLVHAYRPTPGMPDVWVIPVLAPGSSSASAGHVVMLLDFAYDPTQQRLRVLSFAGPFVAGDPEFGQAFPRASAQQALATFATQRIGGVAPSAATLASAQTELVYFPVDLNKLNDPQHPMSWTAGGQFPDLAVWRVSAPGAADTIIGLDGRAYPSTQLPLAANAAPAGS